MVAPRMPLGLSRRSYESRPSISPLSSVVLDNDADSGDNGNRGPEKHRRTDHHRSASFDDAAPRPRVAFPRPFFKTLPAFCHEYHRRSQHKPAVDTHADQNLHSDSTTYPQSTDPFVSSTQAQSHHQPSRLLGFFTQSTSTGSPPSKSRRSDPHSKGDSPQPRQEVSANRDTMASVASSTALNKGHTTSPSKVCLSSPLTLLTSASHY